jgi:hypothetical protein
MLGDKQKSFITLAPVVLALWDWVTPGIAALANVDGIKFLNRREKVLRHFINFRFCRLPFYQLA